MKSLQLPVSCVKGREGESGPCHDSIGSRAEPAQ